MKATIHRLERVGVRGWVLATVVAAFSAGIVAQQRPPQAAPEEHLDAAREVRALRGELQQAVKAIVSAQTVVGRLQLIDRRMSFLAAQLADVRRELALQEARRETPRQALKRAEEGIAEGLEGFDQVVAQARAEMAEVDQAEKLLRVREAQFTNQMKAEEQKWVTLDARLNELETPRR